MVRVEIGDVVRIAMRDRRLGRGVGVRSVLERLVGLMAWRRARGLATRSGWCVQVSQVWLASAVGLRREWVCECLGRLEAAGYLRVWRRRGVGGRYAVSWYGLGGRLVGCLARMYGGRVGRVARHTIRRVLTVQDSSHGVVDVGGLGGGDSRLRAALVRLLQRAGMGP